MTDTNRDIGHEDIGEASPMTESLAFVGTLAIILIGIAVLLQIVAVEEASGFIGRAVLAFLLLAVALCILRDLWVRVIVPFLSPTFEFLKTLIAWLLVTMVGLIAVSIVGRIVIRRDLTLRRDPQTGDGYDINDSKDAQD
jgi:hypothetical protein